jgi:hypothetical protein
MVDMSSYMLLLLCANDVKRGERRRKEKEGEGEENQTWNKR